MIEENIEKIKQQVAEKFGRTLDTTGDFVQLSDTIAEAIRERVSKSTLERLYGYVPYHGKIGVTTCSILARFLGYRGWSDFCEQQDQSDFITDECVESARLNVGDMVEFQWLPNRTCTAKCLGESMFLIVEAANAKIKVGDTFTTTEFRLKQPLYLTILPATEGGATKEYVAGYRNGISYLKVRSV